MGYSTVAVQGGRVYTMGYDREAGLDLVWCLDAKTGEEIWVHSYPAAIWNQAHEGGTVNTPSIDGDVVYTLNREGNAYCFDAATGEVKWHRNLKEEHDLEYPTWGFSASPLVLDGELILNCGKLISLAKDSGDLLWASKQYGHAYGTPAAIEVEGEPAIAALNGNGVAVVSRKTGEELFFYDFAGQNRGVNAATPIVIDDAMFVSSGPRGGGALLAFGDGELIPVWENRSMANSFSGCVRLGDSMYGFDGSVLKCINLDGESQWEERGIGNGAVIATKDRLILMSSKGELIVATATPDSFEEQSRVKLFDGGSFWTKPILVNGIIYCRSSKGELVARDHRLATDEG
jgi:outer membrane protein assembly factor BamB